MRVVIATHGHCFDGLASAVWFTRLLRELEGDHHEFRYKNCGYGAGQLRAGDEMFVGDQNALLDFRFSSSERLDWFFDHHRTGLQTRADREAFDRRLEDGRRYYFQPDFTSCTKLIAQVAESDFGVVAPELDELMRWADVVDAAQFETAERAIDRTHPVMRLVSVVEHSGDEAFIHRIVPELLQRPLIEVAQLPEVQRRYGPLQVRHERFVRRVRETAELRGRVVLVDLTTGTTELLSKFVTYALYPQCTYSVVVARLSQGAKITVGYNPWSGQPLDTDISAICARYGGGGHSVVGGISFPASEMNRARSVARGITEELANLS